MASLIGYYSLIFGLCSSFFIIFFSVKNFKDSSTFNNKILSLTFLQLFFVVVSFFGLILSFVNSDFSNETVFNHSHTTKPLFYKISGTWGNHEGSLLLWLLVLSIFLLIFTITSKNLSNKYRILTLFFQEIIICWKKIDNNLYFEGCFFENIIKRKINKVKTSCQSNKLPSWFPHVPEIL